MTKVCRSCQQAKPLAGFYRHKQMLDGHLNVCIDCVKARVRKHRRLNESVREYDRERAKTPTRRAHNRDITIRWRAENPAAYKAQTAVNNAVRDGKLIREPCLFCGNDDVHAHHKDYAKPLDVTWLCARCHQRLHAMERAA